MTPELPQKNTLPTSLETLAQHLPDGVLLLDSLGTVLYLNPPLERLFKTTMTAARGTHAGDLLQDLDLLNRAFNAIAGMQIDSVECVLGELRQEFNITFVPFLADGESRLYVLFADVTESRQVARLQKTFIENVSHELRTPLTSIQGFVEALEGGALREPENAAKFLAIIREHTQRLIKLVNAQLDIIKLERGLVSFRFRRVNLHDLVSSVESIFHNAMAENELLWELDVPPELTVIADSDRLEQVLINLVDNAVKFTDPGGRITVRGQLLGQRALIIVEDTGCGIPQDDRLLIFRKFYKAHLRLPRPVRGFGLGLSITGEIIKAHRGVIRIESEVGQGTTVKITLPQTELSTSESE